jgi:hypothetical protein
VLHIGLLLGVARPGQREAGKQTGRAHRHKFVLVEEVVIAALMAKEQPVVAGRLGRHALLQESAERRQTGAGPIMIIGTFGSAGSAKCCAFCT